MSTTSTSTSSRCAPPPPWSPCPERAGRRGYHALVSEPPDQELLEAWRAGDRDSGTALFRRYFRQLRRFFYNKVPEGDVEDLMQRTFIALVETPSGFRGESSFRTFLFAIAWRVFHRHLRDHARRYSKHIDEPHLSSLAELGLTPGTAIAMEQDQERLRRALQRIPVHYQTIIELHYWEELPAPEIACVLELDPTTVRTRLYRARRALERELAASNQVPLDVEIVARAVGQRI